MTKETYQEALKQAEKELSDLNIKLSNLIKNKNAIDRRIAKVSGTIAGLKSLIDEDDTDIQNLGLTDACRDVLRSVYHSLTVKEVCERLQEEGFDTAKYVRPDSAVATIMQRLHERGEAKRTTDAGELRYEWNRSPTAPPGMHRVSSSVTMNHESLQAVVRPENVLAEIIAEESKKK
ncbi:MAG: helix-turn-helix domain-containing protein [Acidobacteriia bacterium]|nr:helix-turn-helix domain-containing protein [Terriglobia bacterium]